MRSTALMRQLLLFSVKRRSKRQRLVSRSFSKAAHERFSLHQAKIALAGAKKQAEAEEKARKEAKKEKRRLRAGKEATEARAAKEEARSC